LGYHTITTTKTEPQQTLNQMEQNNRKRGEQIWYFC